MDTEHNHRICHRMTGSSRTFIYEFGTRPTTEHRNEQNTPVFSFSFLTSFLFFSSPFSFLLFFPFFFLLYFFPFSLKWCHVPRHSELFFSRVKISNGRLHTILMHISPPFKQMNFVFETYISELPNICSICSKFGMNEPTCLASPFAHKNTPTWDGSNNDLFIRVLK